MPPSKRRSHDRQPERDRERGVLIHGDPSEIVGLAELRERKARTQSQIADAIGTTQSGVSRLERQRDVLVSTLADYVSATGGRLRLLAEYPEGLVALRVPVLEGTRNERRQQSRAFRVVWQNKRTRQMVCVGRLEYAAQRFVFEYTPEAELDPDFVPFPAFPDLRRRFESVTLFQFFADRLFTAARGGYEDHLSALGLAREEATPVELLARSGGDSPHDTLQVVPEPVELKDGTATLPFLVSGVRHAGDDESLVDARIRRLRASDQLDMQDEPANPKNERAIMLVATDGPVGWIPDHLLEQVHKYRAAGRRLAVSVEKANGHNVPWHLRLLCRLDIGPGITTSTLGD